MGDIADDANDTVLMLSTININRQREKLSPAREWVEDEGDVHCLQCDEVIPPARRKHGFEICVQCAEQSEERIRLLKCRGLAW